MVAVTIGFMPSYYDNNQREKSFREIEKIEKYSQKDIYVRIVYNSFLVARVCMCMCVCVCVDYICVLLCVVV